MYSLKVTDTLVISYKLIIMLSQYCIFNVNPNVIHKIWFLFHAQLQIYGTVMELCVGSFLVLLLSIVK